MMRVGIGYDVHPLSPNRKLMLGGVHVPYERGAEGHSDADVLIHAICDAMLGATALGDIGQHFPDTDPQFKNMKGLALLEQTKSLLQKEGFKVFQTDSVIMLEKPKVAEYLPLMRQNIAKILELDIDLVSVKATTTEKLGFIGEGKGIAAQAIVSVTTINR